MKRSFAICALPLLFVMSGVGAEPWPRQRFVQMSSDPASELCTSASAAVASVPADLYGRLYSKLRALKTRAESNLPIGKLTFYPQRTREFVTVDAKGVERTLQVDYYELDVDNSGGAEMLTLSSGGRGPAGDGDSLYLLARDPSSMPKPVPNDVFVDVALEIGGPNVMFYGAGRDFAPAYYIYPFAFQERNYLLLEGNRPDEPGYLVVELVADKGIVTRCHF